MSGYDEKPRGFFAGLSTEQRAAALAYKGPENIGPRPNTPTVSALKRLGGQDDA